jgi:hypothetical protein
VGLRLRGWATRPAQRVFLPGGWLRRCVERLCERLWLRDALDAAANAEAIGERWGAAAAFWTEVLGQNWRVGGQADRQTDGRTDRGPRTLQNWQAGRQTAVGMTALQVEVEQVGFARRVLPARQQRPRGGWTSNREKEQEKQ